MSPAEKAAKLLMQANDQHGRCAKSLMRALLHIARSAHEIPPEDLSTLAALAGDHVDALVDAVESATEVLTGRAVKRSGVARRAEGPA